jgi:multisubunit Na+/H+ antiporter MnhB subunit
MNLEVFLGYFTGLWLLTPDIDFQRLVYTAAFIHVLDAVVCRVFASRNGSSKNLWTLYGLVCGGWAVLSLIVFPVFWKRLQRSDSGGPKPGERQRSPGQA